MDAKDRRSFARLAGYHGITDVLKFLWIIFPSMALAADGDAGALLREVIATVCNRPMPSLERMAAAIPGSAAIAGENLEMQGAVVGWKRRFRLPDDAEIRLERFAPGGQPRRITAEYWTAAPREGLRPVLAAVADADCTVRLGRRLVYQPDSPQALAIEHLDGKLAPTGVTAPLNPPVPDGRDPGGIPVGIVDAGINYLLPEVNRRLARNIDGTILGYDFWDLDRRPFDANPAGSPFFPQRHGTKTGVLLLREAPMARLVPYRYPRPDMSRMTELIRDAAEKGIVIMNMSLGSDDPDDWDAFSVSARAQPDILFVLSAGNNGRDIDAQPVYPAALQLDNAITVTSSENNGELAYGSNWGKRSVHLLVPAERLIVTDFDGRETTASGSSYAAIRVSALAARLLERHPDWRAPELKAAILARVLPDFSGKRTAVAAGFIPRPDMAEELPQMNAEGDVKQVARRFITASELYGNTDDASRHAYSFKPTMVLFEGGAWYPDDLRQLASRAAAILSTCDIYIPEIDVRVLSTPEVYQYFHDRIATELVRQLPLPKPTVYFVRDTIQVDAYDAEAIGKGNSSTRPTLRYTVWFTEGTRDPGVALAHELVHILMDSGQHVELAGNLMRAETSPENTRLTNHQCEAVERSGKENGLLLGMTY